MNVKCIGSKEFLIVNTVTEKNLNPFYINVDKIRYIREYKDKEVHNRFGIVIGEKIFATDELASLQSVEVGETVNIGKEVFLCVMGNSLTGSSGNKSPVKHFLNMNNVLYMRKYFEKDSDNKNVSTESVLSTEIDKFAIITVDNRTLPVGNVFTELIEKNEAQA